MCDKDLSRDSQGLTNRVYFVHNRNTDSSASQTTIEVRLKSTNQTLVRLKSNTFEMRLKSTN